MAVGDRLSEGEKFVLTTPSGRKQRAEVVAEADRLADVLELPHDVALAFVDSIRAKADQVRDPKLAKQLRKAARTLTEGIIEIGARTEPLAIEPAEAAAPEQQAPVELLATPISQTQADVVADVPTSERQARVTKPKAAPAPRAKTSPATLGTPEQKKDDNVNPIQGYLQTLQEGSYEDVKAEEIPATADFIVTYAAIQERSTSSDRRSYVVDLMNGLNKRQIAEANHTTFGAVDQALRKLQEKVQAKLGNDKLSYLINQHLDLASIRAGKDEVVEAQEEPGADPEPVVSPEIPEVIDAPEAQEQDATLKTHEEWLASAKKELTDAMRARQLNGEQVQLLWDHIHFGDDEAYLKDSPRKRQILKGVQLRMMGPGAPDFAPNNRGAAAVKKLVHTLFSFNTMDDVYEDFHARNADLTKAQFEEMVIGVVIELMK